MDTPVALALVTSGSSVAIAVSSAAWTARQTRKTADAQRALARDQAASQSDLERLKAHLQREATEAERSYSAKAELDRFREPLLTAAYELGERIDNIRRRDFFAYLDVGEHRRVNTILSTLFRFSQYFGRVENLYSAIKRSSLRERGGYQGSGRLYRHDREALRNRQTRPNERVCERASDALAGRPARDRRTHA